MFYLLIFLAFVIFTGCLFFGGFDLLLVFFALTTANLFLILAATSSHSPYANMGANREMMQMLAYEPMVLLTAVGFYLSTGTFKVREIITNDSVPPIIMLPGVFVGFVFILTIKLRKHPFDLATSHHAHQEMVKGITTEFSGEMFAIVEISHWYENVFLMGVIALFFLNSKWWTIFIALVAISITYFVLILVDNTNARVKWQKMFRNSWITTIIIGALNVFILEVFTKGV
ncbi:MAG: NADH-quinone oxidoreductase subunit H [Eubacterium sp.]